jgi:hypothetical protein
MRDDIGHNRFGLLAVAAVKMDDQIPDVRKNVRRAEWFAFGFSHGGRL